MKTATILDKIVAHKQQEIALLYRNYDLAKLHQSVQTGQGNFYKKLADAGMRRESFFIAEFKRKSPSEGWIARDADAAEQVRAYARAGACAVSVLTDAHFFGGSYDDLRTAASAEGRPLLLQKDFVLDPIQVHLARQSGADIILLIAAILDAEQLKNLKNLAESLGMGVIVEIHDLADFEKIKHLDCPVLGINNRDLKTFRTALNRFNFLKQHIRAAGKSPFLIAESGIRDYRDLQALKNADGFLIGTTLMRQAPGASLHDLFQTRDPRMLLKACGIRTPELLREETADYTGINFSPASRRRVDPSLLDQGIPANAVAVFYRNTEKEISAILEKYPFRRVQLYAGDVSPEFVRSLRCKVLLACRVRETADLEALEAYAPDVDLFILDGAEPGSGRRIVTAIPADFPYPFLLAGGIHIGNLDLVKKYRNCIGADVASGIETDGMVDPEKVAALLTGVQRPMPYRTAIQASTGYYGAYGGCFVPEVLLPGLEEIAGAFEAIKTDEVFQRDFQEMLQQFSGRPTAFTPLPRLSEQIGGARLYLKNEGLNHTGAHKINHCIGQALLARRLGKKRIIAETGAGQHGYATAAVCARLGLDCTVYMGRKDYERQRPNVYWMELLGARVVPVEDGSQTLNDAVIAAFKDWVAHPDETYYLLGSAVGPHPYPAMNTFFQKMVGEEIRRQCLELTGRLPDACVACVGGGSNALGMFFDFLDEAAVRLIGVEAGGYGTDPGEHASKLSRGRPGVFEGYHSYFLQDGDGNIAATHSVSAGLDYCGVSPILAWLADAGRVDFAVASDAEALEAVQTLARTEGIIPALESAHAFAHAFRLASEMPPESIIVVNASGRGEKDLFITMRHFQEESLTRYARHLLNT